MTKTELKVINKFDYEYKKFLLRDDSVVDKGIKDLVDAINEIDVLVTMNSCQGALIPKEKSKHCPRTYIDFYVLEHQYHIANKLFIALINKFGSNIYCKLWYEADFNYNDDDTVEDNGFINLRYRIELYPENLLNAKKTYKEIVDEVKRFCNVYKEINSGTFERLE